MRGLVTFISAVALVAAAAACSGGSGAPATTDAPEASTAAEPTALQKDDGDDHADPSPPPAPVETPEATTSDPYSEFPTLPPEDEPTPAPAVGYASWRVLSARIYYDEGGGGDLSTVITTRLDVYDDGTWTFGSSSGTWYVDSISSMDWAKWGVAPYGATDKLVLEGWNGDFADGPIESTDGYIDYMWVIYREGPPTIEAPGTVWMKFGAG